MTTARLAAAGAAAAGGGRGWPDAAGDDGRRRRCRVLPRDQRPLPSADGHPQRARDAHSRRRVLRIRLLPVRRALILDAGVGHCRAGRGRPRRSGAAGGAGRAAARRRPRRADRRGRCRRRGARAKPTGTAAFDLRLVRWMDAEKIDGFTRLAALQASDARRRRDRRLPAVRDEQPAGGAHRRTREVARRVRDLPLVDLPEGRRSPARR